MNQWSFVVAAYVVTLARAGVLLIASYVAMRRAEK